MSDNKPRLVILGSSGYVGKYAVEFFKDSFQIFGISRKIHNHSLDPENRDCFFSLDITDNKKLLDILNEIQPHYIINLIGSRNDSNLDEAIEINAELPFFLMSNAQNISQVLKKILWIGSAAEYGHSAAQPIVESMALNPLNGYGLSKVLQTTYLRYFSKITPISMSLLRPFNIVHHEIPNHFAIGSFINNIRLTQNGGSILVKNIQVRRDYISLKDFCIAMKLVLENGLAGEEYNVASNSSYLLSDILNFLIEQSRKSITIEHSIENYKLPLVMNSQGSYEKIFKTCGWKPSESIFDVLKRIDFD